MPVWFGNRVQGPVPIRKEVPTARGVPGGCDGGRLRNGMVFDPWLTQHSLFFWISASKLWRLRLRREKGARGPLRLKPGPQVCPEEGRENRIEMKV